MVQTMVGSASMISRMRSSALFRSSISQVNPYHLIIFPRSSRSGMARIRNQRYCPSVPRRRASVWKGFPAAMAEGHFSFKRSSGWNTFSHPRPRPSSKERPVYSRKFRFRKSAEPSGDFRQIIVGIVSMISRRRSSITSAASSASLWFVLAPFWLMNSAIAI